MTEQTGPEATGPDTTVGVDSATAALGASAAQAGPDFARAIVTDAPTADYPQRMMRFGRLVGSWDVRSKRLDETTGEWSESEFRWIVSYILEGMAVQDVAVVPNDAHPSGFETISTTLRVYDRLMGAWRVSYVEPKRGEFCQLVATPHKSDGIRQDGTRNDDKLIRWNFSKITADSYVWESWVSDDEGATWWLQEHNEGRRVA
ncbi:hypothetical protein [Plantibacter sp. YIM 135249]|uniref:hypothetical protein n=1 Tax=Plantibacter sp. YIM 135249 TaxID=3423918 RepID=UPI003D32BFA5